MTEGDAPIIIYSTFGDMEQAQQVGRMIVEARLGACVNLLPEMISFYQWEGEIEEAREVVMIVKTLKKHEDRLIAFLKDNHSYEEPAILVLPVCGGAAGYLAWLDDMVS